MYHRLLDIAQETSGKFSIDYFNVRFRYPECYILTTIADFDRHKQEFAVTGKKTFLPPGRNYQGSTVLVFPSAMYRQTKEVEVDWDAIRAEKTRQLEAFPQEFLNTLESMVSGGLPEEELREYCKSRKKEIIRSAYDKAKNAVLYDATGSELAVYSPFSITNGTRINFPIVLYFPNVEFLRLVGELTMPDETSLSDSSFSLEFLKDINSKFA